MVQIIEGKGSIAGRIGKGFGQGLAEQLPKEIERSRLSSGLKELGKKDYTGKNQFEIMGDIANIPGMTPEREALAFQQIQKQNYLNKQPGGAKGQPSKEQPGTAQTPGQQPQAQIKPLSEGGFATPSQLKEMKQSRLQSPSYADVNSRTKDIIESGLTQDYGVAEQLARTQLSEDRKAQKEKIAEFEGLASKQIGLDLHGTGIGDYKDVAGEIQKRLLDQGQYLLSQGVSDADAADQISNIAKELGKSSDKVKATGSMMNMFKPAKSKTTDLKAQRKEWEKYGFGEQFDDLAAAQMGITPMQAAHELDPLKNEALIKSIPKKAYFRGANGAKMKEKDMDNIIRKIKPQDNLFALEYELRDKGYDVNYFKERLSKIEDAKEISLTPQQERQRQRPVDNTFYGDLLYQAL